jgi:hypothetical protein
MNLERALPKLATCVPKLSAPGHTLCGRRGMPRAWVDRMYADYLRLGSLEKVGALHGRTRQNMYDIFRRRGLKLNAKQFLPVVEFGGLKFTAQKTHGPHRYLRSTVHRRKRIVYLHHLVWERAHGPIPAGHKLAFRDGNHLNCALENLELLTNSDQVRNQFTKRARAQLLQLLAGEGAGLAAQLRRRAR